MQRNIWDWCTFVPTAFGIGGSITTELYSAGCVGLLKAVKAFDCTRGVQFSTYAVPVILGEIKRLFRDGGIVHISRSLRERATRLQKLQETFEQQHGRSPTVSELSALSGDSVEECGRHCA